MLCPKCHTQMNEGEKSWETIDIDGEAYGNILETTEWRCGKCGYKDTERVSEPARRVIQGD